MKLKNLSALIALISISGCYKDLSELKKDLEAATGVPVTLSATDSDTCAGNQARKLLEEFEALGAQEREAVRKTLSTYKELLILPTVASKWITGERSSLVVGRDVCHVEIVHSQDPFSHKTCNPAFGELEGCESHEVEFCEFKEERTKVLADKLVSRGTEPKTQIIMNASLALQTQTVEDTSRTGIYRTYSHELFQDVKDREDPVLIQALKYGSAKDLTSLYHQPICGEMIGLRDLGRLHLPIMFINFKEIAGGLK